MQGGAGCCHGGEAMAFTSRDEGHLIYVSSSNNVHVLSGQRQGGTCQQTKHIGAPRRGGHPHLSRRTRG